MSSLNLLWLSVVALVQVAHSYAEFGTVTAPCNFEPIYAIPRPKFVPEDVYIRYQPFSSSITAVAPSLRLALNGTHETSWSLHFVQQPTRTTQITDRGLRKRGVFSGDPPIATCRPCDMNGNPLDGGSNNNTASGGVPNCSVTSYDVGHSEFRMKDRDTDNCLTRASLQTELFRHQVLQITVSMLATQALSLQHRSLRTQACHAVLSVTH